MTKKLQSLLLLAAFWCGISAYAAPGGTWTTIEHTAYPTPQNVRAELDGSKVKLSWDGVQWPADGFPEEIDGKTVPTNFTYSIECRVKTTGTDTWSEWWMRTTRNRLDNNGAFVSHWDIEDDVESGKTYQYRIRCYSYIQPDNPHLLENPTRDGYFSEYSETVTAYKTLDKLAITEVSTSHPLNGYTSISVKYTYTSSREAEGEEPLYFTFKAIEIPYPAPGTTPESPAAGGKPYARRDGTPLTVQSLTLTPPNTTKSKKIAADNFALTSSADAGTITWDAYQDLKNYSHDDVTIWIQGWAKSATEGGEPRLVVDEAIGKVAIDTRPCTAKPGTDASGNPAVILTWPKEPTAATYKISRGNNNTYITIADNVADTIFVDTEVQPAVRYAYQVIAKDSTGKEFVASSPFDGYSTLEKIEFVQARQFYPWTTQVAIDIYYKSARQSSTDGEVTYALKAKMADGTEIPIDSKNLTLETVDGMHLLPNDLPFGSKGLPSGATTRLWWNAPADLATVQLPSSVLSGITLQLVPTLAEGAPAGAKPAPTTVTSAGITVDLRTQRTVAYGEQIPVVWEWWRTDGRVEAHDKNVFYVKPEGSETDETMVWHTPEHSGEGTIEVPENEDLWPSFRLVKREMNTDDTDEAQQITLTSEVLFQMPVAVPQNVQATRGNTDALTLTWDAVPYAYKYQIEVTTVNERGATFQRTQHVFDDTQYIDQNAPALGIVGYKVQACFPNNVTSDFSEQVVGWRAIDQVELKGVSTRRPWNGTVDIDLTYKTVRNQFTKLNGTNLPDRKVSVTAKTADGAEFAVQSLMKETLDGDMIWRKQVDGKSPFTLGNASRITDRITWNAPADAPRMYKPNSVITITLQGDEYSEEIKFERTFDLDTRIGVIDVSSSEVNIPIPWSTRWIMPEATEVGVSDNWYSVRTVLADATDNNNPVEMLNTESKLGEGSVSTWTPNKWGLITLTLKFSPRDGGNITMEYAAVFNVVPDFKFTVTQGNRDSIIVEWNELRNIHTYSIRRRAAHTSDAFEEVATCTDTTRWADTSDETIVGEFEYTIMPLNADGTDAWTQFNPVVGYRALDIARLVTIVPAENGTVTADKETAKYGETVTLTITPAIGYEFDRLTVLDGETPINTMQIAEYEGAYTYTFTMPAGDVKVQATFKAIDYPITIEPTENGIVTADKQTAHIGETVTLTVTPDKGYELDEIHVMFGETQLTTVSESEGIHTFVMPAGDVVISTLFKEATGTDVIAPDAVKATTRKVIRNGIVYIIRDGKTYTATGEEVK